jgi:hypothetical protein
MQQDLTIPTTKMTYNMSQKYTNVMVGKHGIQTFGVVVVNVIAFIVVFDFLLFIFPR